MNDLVEKLDALQELFITRLRHDPIFSKVIEGRVSREHLIGVYTEIWHCVRETPRALKAAAGSIELYASDHPRFQGEEFARFKGPLYKELHEEMRAHSQEEKGHDDWMMSDLVALGVPREQVLNSQPCPAMTSYLSLIRQAAVSPTPLGVWGQAYVLEGLGALIWGATVANLIAHSGIPNIENAVYCMDAHAKVDVEHREEARQRLRRLDDARDQRAILFNAQATIETWGMISYDILRREAV